MGSFDSSSSPTENDVLSFLNKTVVGDATYADVINDLIVGTPSATTGSITRLISANPKSRKYDGSFNLTYTVTNTTTTDISTILTNNTLYDTNANSQFISTPSNAKLMARIKALNSSININQLDVKTSTFGYDTTGSHASCFKVEIIPQSWSTMYTGSQWVYWKSALLVQSTNWSSITFGYTGTPSVDLSLSGTTQPTGGTTTYTIDNTYEQYSNFTISSQTLKLNSGLNAGAYKCRIKATINGSSNYDAGDTPWYEISVTVNKANMNLSGNVTIDGSTTGPTLAVNYATTEFTLSHTATLPSGTNNLTYSFSNITALTGTAPASSKFSINNNKLTVTNGIDICSFNITITLKVTNSNYNDGTISTTFKFIINGKINKTFTSDDMGDTKCASNSVYDSSYDVWHAFDGDVAVSWSTASGSCPRCTSSGETCTFVTPIYLKISLPIARVLQQYTIYPRRSLNNWNIYSWTIQANNDFSQNTGTAISTVTSYTWSSTDAQTWSCSSTTAYSCFIIVITQAKINIMSTGERWTGFAEWILNGY